MRSTRRPSGISVLSNENDDDMQLQSLCVYKDI